MQSIVQDVYGSDEQNVLRLEKISRPAIGNADVLVRVRSASVDRGTWHVWPVCPTRSASQASGSVRPRVSIRDGASPAPSSPVGKDVTEFEPGDDVFGTCDGAFAEYARAQPGKLASRPSNLSVEQSAAVPVSALTALQAVRDHAGLQPGEHVLIVGASGAGGTFAVQIAKAGVVARAGRAAAAALGVPSARGNASLFVASSPTRSETSRACGSRPAAARRMAAVSRAARSQSG